MFFSAFTCDSFIFLRAETKTTPKETKQQKNLAEDSYYSEVANQRFACVAAPKIAKVAKFRLNLRFIVVDESNEDKRHKLHRFPRIFTANSSESSLPTHRFNSSLRPCGTKDVFSFCAKTKTEKFSFFSMQHNFFRFVFFANCDTIKLERTLCTAKVHRTSTANRKKSSRENHSIFY